MFRVKNLSLCLRLCLLFGLGSGLVGCSTLAPTYTRPDSSVPPSWHKEGEAQPQNGAAMTAAVADIAWQSFYLDPQLRQVIAMGLANNRDLRVAALNVERSQAQYQIQWSALVPKVDANGVGTFAELSKDFTSEGHSRDSHQYTVALGMSSYELDLFGRVRSLKDQALEQYLATRQAQQSTRISLIGQIAASYLTLAADHELLGLAQETLKAQQESYQLMQRRFEVGASSELDLRQTETQVESARAEVARLTAQVAQDEEALHLLVGGRVPAALLPTALKDEVTTLEGITPGLSSEILLQRPDVLQAENLLKGYQANIGAARAAFFPKITLVGTLGAGSSELSGLFTSGSGSWTFIPRIDLPIFDAGARSAQLRVAEVDRDIAIAQYQKAIQTAFREVADGLAQRSTIGERLAAQQALCVATEKRYVLARERTNIGVDSHLSQLDAQRSLYSAQQGLISLRLTRMANLVTLYKVLGGGVNTEN
jgi:outer membrane protein, multidrug efflux system